MESKALKLAMEMAATQVVQPSHQRPENQPQWTSASPSEPGWYWARNPSGKAYVAEVVRRRDDGELCDANADGWHWRSRPTCTGMSERGWLWWPVRLEAPT